MAYGLLSAAFTGVYVAIVVGLGAVAGRGGGPVLTIAAAICIAVLFQPLRQRFRRFANRLVYGERATPYQVLSDFAEDMAGQLDFTEAVDRMVAVLAGATGGGRLAGHGSSLRFTIADDGAGFDAASTPSGSGLQGMTDRLAALASTLRIQSAPGNGTTLTGELPVSPRGGRPLTTLPATQEQEVS